MYERLIFLALLFVTLVLSFTDFTIDLGLVRNMNSDMKLKKQIQLISFRLQFGDTLKRKEKIIQQNTFVQKEKKPMLKSNPGLALIGLRTTGPWSFLGSNCKAHNHFEVSQWYITWACVAFLFCHLIIIRPKVTQWAGMSKYMY